MNTLTCLLLAALSIWDYPARFPTHQRLRRQFMAALREGDTTTMEKACRKGVQLLPEDSTWHYNLACSLAYFDKREDEAFDELEKAIDLGFRRPDEIAKDGDLARLSKFRRYAQLIEYAKEMKTRPILTGPLATVPATGIFGKSIALGAQNLSWDFESGCFIAQLKLATASAGGNTGDLYMNRDHAHSVLDASAFPGLTVVGLDKEGRDHGADLNAPNILFPYPVFGNSSRAFVDPVRWRSIPRAMMTIDAGALVRFVKLYLSNQFWVFPSNADTPPIGTHGDVFPAVVPYWLTSAGRSFSDQQYLRAALSASASLNASVKREIVKRGLLTPTLQTLIRKSLAGVTNEVAYLTAPAHPSAFPPTGLDVRRLVTQASDLTVESIPPLVAIAVQPKPLSEALPRPEVLYATSFAWAFVLRAKEPERVFTVVARGAKEFAFVQTHGAGVPLRIEQLKPNVARVTVDSRALSPTNRIDLTVVGRNPGTGWGAPSYLSFSRVDASAPYSDPALTLPPPQLTAPATPKAK